MKQGKLILVLATVFIILSQRSAALAQGMVGGELETGVVDDHTAQEELEGKAIWEKLEAKELTCAGLSDDDYAALGEYAMGLAIGDTQRHALMNQMMIRMMGEEGEEEMHVVLGKRYSGCGPDAGYSGNRLGVMPMMGGGGNPMMGGWGGFGLMGGVSMVLFWVLLILGGAALVRYLGGGGGGRGGKERTPLEILKERYARGEVDKREFEEKKKDLA